MKRKIWTNARSVSTPRVSRTLSFTSLALIAAFALPGCHPGLMGRDLKSALNSSPLTAISQTVDVVAGSASITLAASGPSPDAVSFTIVTAPAHGGLSGTPPRLTYAAASASGPSDSFTFVARNGDRYSEPATVTLRHVADLGFSNLALGLPAPAIDDRTRTITADGLPAGRIFTFSVDEDGAGASGLSCANLPAGASVVENHLSVDLGIRLSAGSLDLSCATTQGSFGVKLGYNGSNVAVVSSSLGESASAGVGDAFAAQTADGRYTLWLAKGLGLTQNVQVALKDNVSGRYSLVSANERGAESNADCYSAQVTPDGRYVVFAASGDNLLAGASGDQIYRKDLRTGTLALVSSKGSTAGGDDLSDSPQISADGRYVAFHSYATNLTDVPTAEEHVYRKDLATGTLALVSSKDGTSAARGDSDSESAQMTPDGRYVVFDSFATNLLASPVSGHQVYRRDMQSGSILLVSTDLTASLEGDGDSSAQRISADGRYIAFQSDSSNLVSPPTTGFQVYRKDAQTGAVILVSSKDGTTANQGDGTNSAPGISPNGDVVIFSASSANLIPGANGVQIYARNLPGGIPTLISSRDGTTAGRGDAYSYYPFFASDGKSALFTSTSTNLLSTPTSGQFTFRKDLPTGAVSLVNYARTSALFAMDGYNPYVNPDISANGRYAVFQANSPALRSGGHFQAYAKDLQTGAVTLASSPDATSAHQSDADVADARISGNGGRFVVFSTAATNLTAGATTRQIYRKDLQTSALAIVSASAAGVIGDGDSTSPAITPDGRYVAFVSTSTQLVTGTSSGSQIFLKDLQTGAIALISSVDGTVGQRGNAASLAPQLSADGRYVAFASDATNLEAPHGPVVTRQIYRKDALSGMIVAASANYGNTGDGPSNNPQISPDGSLVVFASASLGLVNQTTNHVQIFLRDLSVDTMTLITGGGLDYAGDNTEPVMSADGRFIAFRSSYEHYVAGAAGTQIYRKDRQAGIIELVSSKDGAGGTASGGYGLRMSADGASLVFVSTGALVPGVTGPQAFLKYLP